MLQKTTRGKKRVSVITGLIVSILLTVTVYATGDYTFGVTDDNQTLFSSFITRQKVVDLLENNTSVKKDDLNTSENFSLGKTKKITINDGKKSGVHYTTATYVKDLLDDNTIKFTSDFDFLNVANDAIITNGLTIDVTHVTSKTYKTTFDIPYETITQNDNSLVLGEEKVITEGQNGIAENDVEVIYHNGVEFQKICTQTILKEKVDKVVAIGTFTYEPVNLNIVKPMADEAQKIEAQKAKAEEEAKANQSPTKSEPIVFSATAYAPCVECCGNANGITASGMKAKYGVVAVDPKVIPLGTKLYVESTDGSYVYGECIAADTGGAIKGKKIDLCFNTYSEALAFGRKSVNVYIIK